MGEGVIRQSSNSFQFRPPEQHSSAVWYGSSHSPLAPPQGYPYSLGQSCTHFPILRSMYHFASLTGRGVGLRVGKGVGFLVGRFVVGAVVIGLDVGIPSGQTL